MENKKFYYLTIISKVCGNEIKRYETLEDATWVQNTIHETFGDDIKTSIIEAEF